MKYLQAIFSANSNYQIEVFKFRLESGLNFKQMEEQILIELEAKDYENISGLRITMIVLVEIK